MQSNIHPSRMTLRIKLTLAYLVITTATVLLAELLSLAIMAWVSQQPLFTLPGLGVHVALMALAAALIGLLLGLWVAHRLTHRIRHALEVSQAWMRGNLALRIGDPSGDELGLLARQMDLLAGRLEEDEEDLDELRERNIRLGDQVHALAVVEERSRLARELHDNVKQHLFSLAMTAGGLRARFDAMEGMPGELAEIVHEVESTAQAVQREMARLIEDLKPGSLHEQGLAEALNDYALLFGAREHLLIYVETQGDDKLLPPPVAEALYRVAQEALHNVARHAQATRVDVNLRCIPEQVSLTIEDNGIGFDTKQPHRGLGLINMHERMMAVGGVLSLESEAGIGTTVVAEASLPHPPGTRPGGARQEERPIPMIENWAWLGQRLVIPVGQTWPWLPADQIHLRRPLVETDGEPLTLRRSSGFLGLRRDIVLQLVQHHTPLIRVHRGRSGYQWEAQGASWALRRVRGAGSRMILTRNGQSLAAIQQQGRLLHTWTEIVYDGHGYRLSQARSHPAQCVLTDEMGSELLLSRDGDAPQIDLLRPLPLPLLVVAIMRVFDEARTAPTTSENLQAAA